MATSMKGKKANPQLEEKLQDIKRMQSNWMRERKLHQEKGVKETPVNTTWTNTKEKPNKRNEPAKKKDSDTISWIVNSGTKPKQKPSLRSRSASPSTRIAKLSSKSSTDIRRDKERRPSEGSNNKSRAGVKSRPSSGCSKLSTGSSQPSSRPSSGSASGASSRPPSGRAALTNESGCGKEDEEDATEVCQLERLNNQSELKLHEPQENQNIQDSINRTKLLTTEKMPHLSNANSESTSSQFQENQSITNQSQSDLQNIGLMNADVFDRLADQIASRVKSELRFERQSVSNMFEDPPKRSILDTENEDEVLSHKCAKCKQLMVPPDHTPTLLVPCGHTFCEACSEDRIKCPTCRTRVTSTAVNTALQQVICQVNSSRLHNTNPLNSTTNRQKFNDSYNPSRYTNRPRIALESRNSRHHVVQSAVSDLRNDDQGQFYQDQYEGLVIRCEALRKEEGDIIHGLDELKSNYDKEKKVLGNIEKEEQRITDEMRKLEEKLHLLSNHKQEYVRRCNDLEIRKREESTRLKIVKETISNHQQNIDKVKMLAGNFNISIE
ncbi:uncharacterized protein LOC117116153 [Anneissia japonica]|uniref:uncharacterized protein LOC117116153 n=1 Tax=Anneissia japonica TaxID=1529436 RepID=UPI001425834E|nr:uncharacterized protein LOC117116153 [Anneissia japonica]